MKDYTYLKNMLAQNLAEVAEWLKNESEQPNKEVLKARMDEINRLYKEMSQGGSTKTADVYFDPGHGWLKVKKDELVKLGIADKITAYSYERGEYAYLEEDCDAGTYITALRKLGIECKMKHHYGEKRSRIRNYDSYTYKAA